MTPDFSLAARAINTLLAKQLRAGQVTEDSARSMAEGFYRRLGVDMAEAGHDLDKKMAALAGRPSSRQLCTHVGIAEHLAARLGERLRFVPERESVLVYDGCVWVDSPAAFRRELANSLKDMVASLYARRKNAEADETQRGCQRAIDSLEGALSGAFDSVAAKVRMYVGQVPENALDGNRGLLNFANGTLVAASGHLMPHAPHWLCTKLVGRPTESTAAGGLSVRPLDWDPAAQCPTWERCVATWCEGDEARIRYLQTLLGYLVSAETKEKKFVVLLGPTDSGKSTLVKALKATLGDDYVKTAALATIFHNKRDGSGPQSDLVRLNKVNLVLASETDRTDPVSAAKVKHLTGDGGNVAARGAYARTETEFRPRFKLLVDTNYPITFDADDAAAWGRMILVEFPPRTFDIDRDLERKLLDERAGIARWLVEGLRRYFAGGLGPVPPDWAAAKERIRDEADPFGAFLAEQFRPDPAAAPIPMTSVAGWWKEWWQDNVGEGRFPGARALRAGLKRRGYRVDHDGRVLQVYGLARAGLAAAVATAAVAAAA